MSRCGRGMWCGRWVSRMSAARWRGCARLKRLVVDGWLVEREQGLFAIASEVNGFAGEGSAATS